jgi:hypothetical protein
MVATFEDEDKSRRGEKLRYQAMGLYLALNAVGYIEVPMVQTGQR